MQIFQARSLKGRSADKSLSETRKLKGEKVSERLRKKIKTLNYTNLRVSNDRVPRQKEV